MNHVNDIPTHPNFTTIVARFHAGHIKGSPDECWPWLGTRTSDDYGVFSIFDGHGIRERWATHRMSWVLANGIIPDGLWVLHRCDNPPCINPAHLFLGTPADNSADMVAKNRGARGERAGVAKLTAEQVLAIRADPRPDAVIARSYDLSHVTVNGIKRGLHWRHLSTTVVDRPRSDRGTAHYQARLYPDAVRDIRTKRMSQQKFAELYGVTQSTVGEAARGETWKHVVEKDTSE